MSCYMQKYVGKYRVIAEFDINKNDFPRNKDGEIDPSFTDAYIKCKGGARIWHYGGTTLVGYIPSLIRGRRLLRELCVITGLEKSVDNLPMDYVRKILVENDILIFIPIDSDSEVEFKFKSNKIDLIAELLEASTWGADISPFSVKNLRKVKYSIPSKDLALYKEITKGIDGGSLHIINKLNKEFLSKIKPKSIGITTKEDMKRSGLKTKDYIHSIGLWSDYIIFLESNLI